jgi:hypothetical protein
MLCMRLSVQEEIVDVSQVGGSFNGRHQQFANTETPVRTAYGHATDFGRRTVVSQHHARRPYRPAVSQCNEMKSVAVMFIALQINRNALLDDEDFISNPKTLF